MQDLDVEVGSRRLLADVSFTIAPGELVLLRGPSGSGKSTLLHVLGGLDRPDLRIRGDCQVDGETPASLAPRALAARLGHLFQDPAHQLLAFDVGGEIAFKLENLAVPEPQGVPRVEGALGWWGLEPLRRRESRTLSGGETKRVALAAALVTRPGLVLLDEPLTSLDPGWAAKLLEDLGRLKGKATIVVAEHRYEPLLPLADRILHVSDGRVVEESVAPLPKKSPPARSRPHGAAPAPRLVFDHVSFGHAGAPRAVLEGASAELGPGVWALVGANGAGKTTLLRVAAGFLAPASGEVRMDGLQVHRARPRDLARRVGYVPQRAEDLFTEGSAAEEIELAPRALGLPWDADRTLAHARRFHLESLLERHPWSLSGGERQRLALAGATSHAPSVLLLDEPTLGLDDLARAMLDRLLREAGQRSLVLVATHDIDLLAQADRVLVLHDGALSALGEAENFLLSPWPARLGWSLPEVIRA